LFTIGVELVKPCILSAEKHVLALQAAQKLECIPFPDDTVQQKIEDKATDIEK